MPGTLTLTALTVGSVTLSGLTPDAGLYPSATTFPGATVYPNKVLALSIPSVGTLTLGTP